MAKVSRTSTRKAAKKPAKKVAKKPVAKKAVKKPIGGGAAGQKARLMPAPKSGVTVRMYRQGHGDCYLLAFRGKNGKPVYVLIDCGYKPGSNVDFGLHDISTIIEDIGASTGNRLDLVVVTHEHQDHVNGFGKAGSSDFDPIEMKEAWFAWTEDPNDDLANELRRRYHDTLVGLVAARNQLAAGSTAYIDGLLALELGVEDPANFAVAAAAKKKNPEASVNKQGMRLIKDKVGKANVKFIRPHGDALSIPNVDGVKVYALGPPHDADLLGDENPQGSEAFPGHGVAARGSFLGAVIALDRRANGAANAAASADGDDTTPDDLQPFGRRFAIPLEEAFDHPEHKDFFRGHYGRDDLPEAAATLQEESASNPAWRRIDKDWLFSAEELALVLNKGINNTSLVLAFELEKSKKVLLFVGDAQRGNWKSWNWNTKDKKIDPAKTALVRDLMARTVLYKVGHHGSHNATLSGTAASEYPSLAWMGQGKFADEFAAMINAVNKWALAVKPKRWVHPLPSIKAALMEKTGGRLFQTDTDAPPGPSDPTSSDWRDFQKRTRTDPDRLYFEYRCARSVGRPEV